MAQVMCCENFQFGQSLIVLSLQFFQAGPSFNAIGISFVISGYICSLYRRRFDQLRNPPLSLNIAPDGADSSLLHRGISGPSVSAQGH
jgi:hypothetical protein